MYILICWLNTGSVAHEEQKRFVRTELVPKFPSLQLSREFGNVISFPQLILKGDSGKLNLDRI